MAELELPTLLVEEVLLVRPAAPVVLANRSPESDGTDVGSGWMSWPWRVSTTDSSTPGRFAISGWSVIPSMNSMTMNGQP